MHPQRPSELFDCNEQRKKHTIRKKHDDVTVENRRNSVSHSYDGAVREFMSDNSLKNGVCCRINGSSCFVKNQNSVPSQKHSSKAKQLALPHTPVISLIIHCSVNQQLDELRTTSTLNFKLLNKYLLTIILEPA